MIDSELRNMHRKGKEANHIKFRGAILNRTRGYDLLDLYLTLLREEETRGRGRERLIVHASTVVTTSSTAALSVEAKLLVGEILEVIFYLMFLC